VWLVVDGGLLWMQAEGVVREQDKVYEYDNLCLQFYFPKQNMMRIVRIKTCLMCFAKP
jgi:hypothetical protein